MKKFLVTLAVLAGLLAAAPSAQAYNPDPGLSVNEACFYVNQVVASESNSNASLAAYYRYGNGNVFFNNWLSISWSRADANNVSCRIGRHYTVQMAGSPAVHCYSNLGVNENPTNGAKSIWPGWTERAACYA